MNRRMFLATSSVAGITTLVSRATASLGMPESRSSHEPKSFRTITYNILAARGYPVRNENKSRLEGARKRMAERFALELAVYDPDLVTFQESPSENVVAQIAKHLGTHYVYFQGGFPGSVLTKHKIVDSTNRPAASDQELPIELFSRHWGRANLDVNGSNLIVYTAHLHPGDDALRLRECDAMLVAMKEDLQSGNNVILQGDLNDSPGSPMYQRLQQAGMQDAFAAKGKGAGLTCSSNNLRWRIDYVWSIGPISKSIRECRVLAEGPFIDHPNDPAGFALSDHLPVLAEYCLE